MKKILLISLLIVSLLLGSCQLPAVPGEDDHVCRVPELVEGENGNWWLGEEDTGIAVDPEISVGENGNWWVNGVDTQIKATSEVTDTSTRIFSNGGIDYCKITLTFAGGATKDVFVEIPGSDEFIPTGTVTNGYGGTNGIVCLMTDNDSGKFETLALLDELYVKYGLVGGLGTVAKNLYTDTTYTTPKTADVNKWQEFLDTGRWSIICHSMTHTTYCDTVDGEKVVNEDRIFEEIVTSAELLRQLFPGERVLTYAMTGTQSAIGSNSDPTNIREAERQLIAEYYIGGRFSYTGPQSYDELQWNNLPYALLSTANLDYIIKNIDKAAKEGKYYMVYNHYVIEDELIGTVNQSSWTTKSTAEALCQKVAEHVQDGSLWCAQFEDAVMYMRERATSSIATVFEDGKIKVFLTDGMDNTIYNHKLTVKLTVPEEWDAVKITQGEDVSYAKVVEEDGERYALVNLLPDNGVGCVEQISENRVPESKPEIVKPTPEI